jgi:membrane-associated phospholipid phosphatase
MERHMASRSEPKDGRRSAAGSIDAPPVDPPTTPDKLGMVQLAVGFCIALGAMLAFALIAINITNQEAVALDTFANPFLHSIASPVLDGVMNAITSLGSGPVLGLLFVLVAGALLVRGNRAEALFLAVAIGGSVALNGTLKVAVERPRPVLPWAHVLPDYSFPSGHTMNSLVFYLAVALIVWATFGKRPGALAVALALVIAVAIGFSRIYLGYHYLSDVVGGLAAGIAWLLVVALAFETIPRSWARRQRAKLPS